MTQFYDDMITNLNKRGVLERGFFRYHRSSAECLAWLMTISALKEPLVSMSEIQDSNAFLCSLFNFSSSLIAQKSHKSSRFAVTLFICCSFPILSRMQY